MKADALRETVTAQIVAALKTGVKPWSPSWRGAGALHRPLRHNGQPYRGINVIMLWMSAQERGFASPYWMTYRQAAALDAQVAKGSKGTPVIAFQPADPDADPDDRRARPFSRAYYVFNADQIEGLPAHFKASEEPVSSSNDPLDAYELMMRHCDVRYEEHAGGAFYRPSTDTVHWPNVRDFTTPAAQFATAAHELGHASGAAHRLNREGIVGKRTTASYAYEELVAELTAAFVGARAGIFGEHLDDHSAYLDHWLKVLEEPAALFRAAREAETAADFVFPETFEAQLLSTRTAVAA